MVLGEVVFVVVGFGRMAFGCGVFPFDWLLELRSKVLWEDCVCYKEKKSEAWILVSIYGIFNSYQVI